MPQLMLYYHQLDFPFTQSPETMCSSKTYIPRNITMFVSVTTFCYFHPVHRKSDISGVWSIDKVRRSKVECRRSLDYSVLRKIVHASASSRLAYRTFLREPQDHDLFASLRPV
jgi:hypothetical protein